MLSQAKAMLELVLAQDELFERGAKIMKKSLDYYMKEGFTREEAVLLLAHQGPIAKGSN